LRTKYSKKNRINVVTLGCSKNIYDSEVLMGQLKANNKDVVHEKEGNIVVINTCGFIDNAKQESIDTILDYSSKKQNGKIDKLFVTGCLSERYMPDLKKEIPNVDQYFGTTDLPKLLKALKADYKHELVGERLTTTPKNYAYLKISEGCDRPCSFCAIPLMRGKHKSKSIEDIITEASKLASNGVKELILIAQDDVLEVIKNEPKVCNYLDIPLQHISTKILKSMRRGSKKENIIDLINQIRLSNPLIAIRTTLIVGYPGETDQEFNELKQWVSETRFDRLGCFTYSHEENTHAYNLVDDVSEDVKIKRMNEIMDIQSQISFEINQTKIGKTYKCVIDRKEGAFYVGRTEHDSPDVDNEVLIDASEYYLKIGDFTNLKITSSTEFDLYGSPES